MSQHDMNIANQGFPAFRADLNDALQALGSNQSGTSAPSPTFANQIWYDTTNNQLKQRNQDNDAWIVIAELDQTTDTLIAIGGKTLPSGSIVGTSDAQTLINKTINGSQLVDGSVALSKLASIPSSVNMKNRIINGAMVIDQRNAGASVTPTGNQYLVDRWQAGANVASKYSVQQSSTAPVGFTNSMLITSLSAYSVGATDVTFLQQRIEGYNVADLKWGTADAKTITISAWVRSSLTGTFGGVVQNRDANRSYPFTYSIPSANTWTQISITIAGDTTGTWATNNDTGLRLNFGLGVGSTYSGTAGAWAGAEYYGATGATSVVGTNGATFYITGVQLEVGSSATGFDYRQYGTELALCQRYFQKSYAIGTTPASVANGGAVMTPYAGSGNTLRATIPFKVSMRTNPTTTIYNPETGTAGYWGNEGAGATNQAAGGVTFTSEYSALVYSTSAPIAGIYYFQFKNDAEL